MPDTIIVVPTYNEKENIRNLIPILLDIGPHIGLLVVDDNSPDGTAEYVKTVAAENPRVELLTRPGKMGLGSAYITGFKHALGKGAKHIVQMDADFSHDPKYIHDFLKLWMNMISPLDRAMSRALTSSTGRCTGCS